MRYAIQIHILPFAIRRSVNRRVFCRVLATQGNHWQSLRPKWSEMQTQWQLEDVASVISCPRNVNHIYYMVLEPFYRLASSWHMLRRIHKQTRVWPTSHSNQFPAVQVWDCSQWPQILYIYIYICVYLHTHNTYRRISIPTSMFHTDASSRPSNPRDLTGHIQSIPPYHHVPVARTCLVCRPAWSASSKQVTLGVRKW